MDIAATTAATSTNSKAAESSTKLTSDLDTFLKLLTTQLKNQDPLEPLDANEFTNQLVQFSSVEQAIQTNQNLESLIAMQGVSGAGVATGYIGHTVTAETSKIALTNGQATLRYALDRDADALSITISDASGRTVRTLTGPRGAGEQTLAWDGKDNFGRPVADGVYSISVAARDSEEVQVKATTELTGVVTGASFKDGDAMVDVGGVSIPLSAVKTVRKTTASGA